MESLWKKTARLPAFEPLDCDKKTDVLIVGGGLAGILCAYMLDQAGVDYILVEADRIGSGITGNTTAKITSQHGLIYAKLIKQFGTEKAAMYLSANQEALQRYRNMAQSLPCDFKDVDSAVYSVSDRRKLERELDALHRLGHTAELKESLPIPVSIAGAVMFPNQAQFHPLKFLSFVAEELNIHENTMVRSYDGKAYITDHGSITAKKTIIATHFPILNKHGAYYLKLYQHRSYVLALENAAPANGIYVDERKTGLSFRDQDDFLLLGGGSHRTGKHGGNWNELEAFARAHYPEANIAYRWATQDCMTLDGVPYIGQYAKNTPDLYVATGFNKWGVTGSMVSAMLLRDKILGRRNEYEPLFSPSRSVFRPQLLCNAAESTASLLTFTKPRCPHMGCALKWNPNERTWDCPCHGSRFSESGALLDNPSTGDLPRKSERN